MIKKFASIAILAVASFGGMMFASTKASGGQAPIDFYTPAQRSQSFQPCLDVFPKRDISFTNQFGEQWRGTELCSNHFAVFYSKLTKTPLVVVEKLNSQIIADAKGEERTDNFYPDPRLKREDSASLNDYKGSGFDRGHQANAADSPDQISMNQTFALSNMIPQDPVNNRKVFNKLEQDVRKFVKRAQGDVYVFTGPLFKDKSVSTMGSGKVWIPSHIYKLVYDEASGKAWGYILTNTPDARVNRPIDYAQFVSETGIKLLNPALVKGTISN